MHKRSDMLLRWAPRILGFTVCLFVSLFALDAFEEGKTLIQAIPDFLLHLIPTAALVGIIFLSWRREWLGGVMFTGFALVYAYSARDHIDWIATIAVPLLVVGALYFVSWTRGRSPA